MGRVWNQTLANTLNEHIYSLKDGLTDEHFVAKNQGIFACFSAGRRYIRHGSVALLLSGQTPGLGFRWSRSFLCWPGFVSLIDADTTEYRRENDNRAVKKTLSIPSWLNAKAEKAGINFSQVLQEALKQRLGY
ncbi:MAG: hypothetical protein M0Z41_13440 [Peptococcaceae bacterium]|jgi:hypothetical protein|nr:hypothetical protein [Peptococcaceae bacterium]